MFLPSCETKVAKFTLFTVLKEFMDQGTLLKVLKIICVLCFSFDNAFRCGGMRK